MKTAFIGHRHIFDVELGKRLFDAVEHEIKGGCLNFAVGTHGDFDRAALDVCRQLRKKYKNIKIEVVITSLAQVKPVIQRDKIFGDEVFKPYDDVQTTMYEIEDVHFKRKITESNMKCLTPATG